MESLSLLLVWTLLNLFGPSRGEIVGAAVMPHGGIALDPSHFATPNPEALREAWMLHKACQDVGQWVGSLKPDLLLLSTPHGVADLTRFSFFLNSKGAGHADTDNCSCPPCCYNITVDMDTNTTTSLIEKLQVLGANVSGLVGYGDAEPFPLRWGEVIPLHFISPSLPTTSSGGKPTRVLILSQPNRRYTQSVQMIPELLSLGTELFAFLEPLKERVAVIISADQAHTHLSSGPYGFSNASEPFDLAVGEWASKLNGTALLVEAADYVERALSCGYTGLVMLHGLMEAREATFTNSVTVHSQLASGRLRADLKCPGYGTWTPECVVALPPAQTVGPPTVDTQEARLFPCGLQRFHCRAIIGSTP